MVVTALLVSAVLHGCASGKRVDEADRDTMGNYDGSYTLKINSYRGRQSFPGNWSSNCTTDGWEWPIRVSSGKLTLNVNFGSDGQERIPTGFVNAAGQFRLDVPTGRSVSASGTSDMTMDNGEVTFILGGSLADGDLSGRFTRGIAQFGNAGCSYKMDIEPLAS